MDKIIVPRKLQGFWELSPEKEIVFEEMIDKIKSVFKKHCFLPLDTPVMELSEILLAKSGGDVDKEIYRFVKGSTDACLRYDFTVPLARYVAMNENTLNFPFKRYQIGKNYRGERPQKGRRREFYQCDADVVGDGKLSLANDAECIKLYEDIFSVLELDAEVEISSRKTLFGIVKALGYENMFSDIAIILDKMDKLGEKEIGVMLKELQVKEEACNKLVSYAKLRGGKEVLDKALLLCEEQTFVEGVNELKQVCEYLEAMGGEKYIINFGIIRGHNYYTGTVFEAFLKGKRNLGAIGAGGRYDELASYFSSRHLPGVGMSIGISRLFDILESEGLISESEAITTVAIIPLGNTLNESLGLCAKMQKEGVKAEVFAEEKSFKSKMKDAGRRNIPYVAILGEDEVKANKVTIKNMNTSEQQTLSYDEALKIVR